LSDPRREPRDVQAQERAEEPVQRDNAAAGLRERYLKERRDYQETEEFRERYAARAGIEATNSELKRAHGLGHPRTRRLPRIRLAVYLKTAACNVKRMVNHLVEMAAKAARAAELAAADALQEFARASERRLGRESAGATPIPHHLAPYVRFHAALPA